MPFTSNVVVNEDVILDLIDQMRISVPEEVKQAKRLAAERERVLDQSRQEAERIVAAAQQRVGNLTSEHVVVKSAQDQAEEIVAEANRSAGEIRAEADAYVKDVLSDMEEHLLKLITTVRNGIQQVDRSNVVRGRERAKRETPMGRSETPKE